MSDRFPYNMYSRDALVELVRRSTNRPDLKDDEVTFEDLFFSPAEGEPGRTYIDMVDVKTTFKEWFEFRRLDLGDPRCLGPRVNIKLLGDPTPENIALEINRSRNMKFDASDLSFSDELLPVKDNVFEYDLVAMTGSYVYYGQTKVRVELVPNSRWDRFTENGYLRQTEDRIIRELEH